MLFYDPPKEILRKKDPCGSFPPGGAEGQHGFDHGEKFHLLFRNAAVAAEVVFIVVGARIVSAIPLKINRSGGFLINRELLVSLHREMHLMNLSVAADVAVFAQKRQNAAVTCGEIHFRMTDILNPFA